MFGAPICSARGAAKPSFCAVAGAPRWSTVGQRKVATPQATSPLQIVESVCDIESVEPRGIAMDPVSLVITALATGASVALKDTATEAVKDAYAAFKAFIKRRLGDKPDADLIVEKHEQAPDVWEKPLNAELAEVGVDDEMVEAAQALLAKVDPAGSAANKYVVTMTNATGVVIGEHNQVTQNIQPG